MNVPVEQDTSAAGPTWTRALVRPAVSILLLGLLLYFLPFHELRDAAAKVSPFMWLAALAIYMALHAIGVAKWRMLVNAAGADLSVLHAVRCYYLGLFGNTFLPSVVGGDVIRAGAAMRRAASREGLVLGSMADRVQDVIGLAAVAGIGAAMLPAALDADSRRIFWILGLVCGGFGAGILLLVRLLPGRLFPWRLRRRLVRIRTAFRALSSRPRALITAFLLGMVLQTLQVALNAWLGAMIGVTAPFHVWLFVWPLAKVAATLPLTQGGLGVREAALAALFAPFGIAAVSAVAASLAFQVVVFSGGLLGGGLFLALGRLQPRDRDRGHTGVAPPVRVLTTGS